MYRACQLRSCPRELIFPLTFRLFWFTLEVTAMLKRVFYFVGSSVPAGNRRFQAHRHSLGDCGHGGPAFLPYRTGLRKSILTGPSSMSRRLGGERRQSPFTLLEKNLQNSRAFLDLSRTSIIVLLKFLGLCYIKNATVGKERVRIVTNNGQLRLTFEEAEKMGLSRASFNRAIRELIDHGFLSIAHQGSGLHRDANLYHLDCRWAKWGTVEFEVIRRPCARFGTGFRKGNALSPRRRDGTILRMVSKETLEDFRIGPL